MVMRPIFRATVILIGIVILGTPGAEGYDRYSEDDDATYCRSCHGDFRSGSYISPVDGQNWGNLHNIHRSTMLSGDCDVCHIGNDKLPVFLNSSDGGDGFEAVGCMGCHGVDPAPGEPDNLWWGAGLRLHHTNAGVEADSNGFTCASCHADDPSPPPENTQPSYYFLPDTNHPSKPVDPCNQAPGFSENFAGAVMGIDNDGDLVYDDSDSDCAEATPTPTATSTPTWTPTWTPTQTPTVPPVVTNTPTPTTVPPTPTPGPSLVFGDGFESGDTSGWSSFAKVLTEGLDRVEFLGRKPLTNGTVFLIMFAGAALAGLPRIRERRHHRREDDR
jgi:hypothetical protein